MRVAVATLRTLVYLSNSVFASAPTGYPTLSIVGSTANWLGHINPLSQQETLALIAVGIENLNATELIIATKNFVTTQTQQLIPITTPYSNYEIVAIRNISDMILGADNSCSCLKLFSTAESRTIVDGLTNPHSITFGKVVSVPGRDFHDRLDVYVSFSADSQKSTIKLVQLDFLNSSKVSIDPQGQELNWDVAGVKTKLMYTYLKGLYYVSTAGFYHFFHNSTGHYSTLKVNISEDPRDGSFSQAGITSTVLDVLAFHENLFFLLEKSGPKTYIRVLDLAREFLTTFSKEHQLDLLGILSVTSIIMVSRDGGNIIIANVTEADADCDLTNLENYPYNFTTCERINTDEISSQLPGTSKVLWTHTVYGHTRCSNSTGIIYQLYCDKHEKRNAWKIYHQYSFTNSTLTPKPTPSVNWEAYAGYMVVGLLVVIILIAVIIKSIKLACKNNARKYTAMRALPGKEWAATTQLPDDKTTVFKLRRGLLNTAGIHHKLQSVSTKVRKLDFKEAVLLEDLEAALKCEDWCDQLPPPNKKRNGFEGIIPFGYINQFEECSLILSTCVTSNHRTIWQILHRNHSYSHPHHQRRSMPLSIISSRKVLKLDIENMNSAATLDEFYGDSEGVSSACTFDAADIENFALSYLNWYYLLGGDLRDVRKVQFIGDLFVNHLDHELYPYVLQSLDELNTRIFADVKGVEGYLSLMGAVRLKAIEIVRDRRERIEQTGSPNSLQLLYKKNMLPHKSKSKKRRRRPTRVKKDYKSPKDDNDDPPASRQYQRIPSGMHVQSTASVIPAKMNAPKPVKPSKSGR